MVDLIPVGMEEESMNNLVRVLKFLQSSQRSARCSFPVAMEVLDAALRAWSSGGRVVDWWGLGVICSDST